LLLFCFHFFYLFFFLLMLFCYESTFLSVILVSPGFVFSKVSLRQRGCRLLLPLAEPRVGGAWLGPPPPPVPSPLCPPLVPVPPLPGPPRIWRAASAL
jgi:hypothetical protein